MCIASFTKMLGISKYAACGSETSTIAENMSYSQYAKSFSNTDSLVYCLFVMYWLRVDVKVDRRMERQP